MTQVGSDDKTSRNFLLTLRAIAHFKFIEYKPECIQGP